MMMIAGSMENTSPGSVFELVNLLRDHYGLRDSDIKTLSANHHDSAAWTAFKEDFNRRSNGNATHLWDNVVGLMGKHCDQFVVYYMWDKRDSMLKKPIVYVEIQDEDPALAFELKLTILAD